jgi:hypothetical protein
MPDMKSVDNVYLVLGFLVPGLIIIFVRAQFTTGRIPPHKEALLTYLTLSVIYYAFVLPAVAFVLTLGVKRQAVEVVPACPSRQAAHLTL